MRRELPGPRQPEHPSLRITSPKNHATIRPGETIHVTVIANGIFSVVVIWPQDPLPVSPTRDKPPYAFELQIPSDIDRGTYSITAEGMLTSGERVESDSVEIDVELPAQ